MCGAEGLDSPLLAGTKDPLPSCTCFCTNHELRAILEPLPRPQTVVHKAKQAGMYSSPRSANAARKKRGHWVLKYRNNFNPLSEQRRSRGWTGAPTLRFGIPRLGSDLSVPDTDPTRGAGTGSNTSAEVTLALGTRTTKFAARIFQSTSNCSEYFLPGHHRMARDASRDRGICRPRLEAQACLAINVVYWRTQGLYLRSGLFGLLY